MYKHKEPTSEADDSGRILTKANSMRTCRMKSRLSLYNAKEVVFLNNVKFSDKINESAEAPPVRTFWGTREQTDFDIKQIM